MKKVDFIGLGAQKCASSWLYRVLEDHPEIGVSHPKELNFFSSNFAFGWQWYENFFAKHNLSNTLTGEISPSYFYDLDAPQRAYSYNPDFKIIVALRDPVERAYSNHLHEIRMEHFQGNDLSFEQGLKNNPMYIEQSNYAKHLAHWFKVFPRKQFFIVFQEDINLSATEVATNLYRFLEIDDTFTSESLEKRNNQSYLPRSRLIEKMIKKTGKILRNSGLESITNLAHASGLMELIHKGMRQNIRNIIPPMLEPTRLQLYDAFREDMTALSILLERKHFPWKTWKYLINK